LVPSFHPTGPIKGAFALANALAPKGDVTLVSVKKGDDAQAYLHPQVEMLFLANKARSFRGRLQAYKKLLDKAGGRLKVASISMCFSADLLNVFCSKQAVTCSSVRGNLPANYRLD
jgi:hypothetical protein